MGGLDEVTGVNDQELIAFAWRYGHFFDPSQPECWEVKESDLPRLTLADEVVVKAVQSLQRSDSNIDPLAQMYHNRIAVFDGGVGPATRALAQLPRCPLPDFAPPPGAQFTTGDCDVDRAVQSMQAVGSGSWPAGCHGTPGVHEVKISYNLAGAASKQREWWDEIKKRSTAIMAAVGVRLLEVAAGQPTQIAVSFRSLGGSTIGLAEFNNGTCGGSVFCYLNPNYAPNIDQVLVLLLHENGHNWNLQHRSGNIMNPSILNVKPAWVERSGSQVVYQDNSYPTLKKFFGGEPIDPPSPPPPPLSNVDWTKLPV